MLPKIVISLILSVLFTTHDGINESDDGVSGSHGVDDARLLFIGIGDNGFELQITDSDPSTALIFSPSIEISVSVGERESLILDAAGRDTLPLFVADELPIQGMIDAVSLPSHAPGIYPLVVRAEGGGRPFPPLELQAKVGCTDPKYATFMECIANCQTWELQW